MKGLTKLLVTMALTIGPMACVLPLDVVAENEEDARVTGSGHVVTRSWTVEDFDAVRALGIGRVIITKTGRESLTVTGEDNILSRLEIEVRDGVLHVGPRAGANLKPTRDLLFRLEAKELGLIEGSGAVSFDADLGRAEALFVRLSGASNLEATGEVRALDVRTSGASWFFGRDLTSRSADVSTSGATAVVVNAAERLRATASGVSSIRYVGSPALHSTVSGLASVCQY